jgi:transmembrane channel-like protein
LSFILFFPTQNATKLRLQGLDQIKWQRRKAWQRLQAKCSEYWNKMELWKDSLKKIESNFGTGVVAYFLFLRWLMVLNLSIFCLIFVFVVLPQLTIQQPPELPCDTLTHPNSTQCCAQLYDNKSVSDQLSLLDVIQGTGFMEKTLLFYGMYTNKIFGYNPLEPASNSTLKQSLFSNFYYDLPLAYIIITMFYYLMSLVAIVRSAASEFKDRLLEGEGQFYQYCFLVFGGWDYCISNYKTADIKHKALYNEIKTLISTKRLENERHQRSRDFMLKLLVIRSVINLVVIAILVVCAVVIYLLFNFSLSQLVPNYKPGSVSPFARVSGFEIPLWTSFGAPSSVLVTTVGSRAVSVSTVPAMTQDDLNFSNMSDLDSLELTVGNNTSDTWPFDKQLTILFYEFLPYIAIVVLNLLVPLLFNYLVVFERYTPIFVIKITLLRTIFLRLSSLAVLLSRFYFLVSPAPTEPCYNAEIGSPICWESYVGQQFYKLFITDFVTHIVVTFFVNFPRSLLARQFPNNRALKFIGEQDFELSKHVLDVVYSQTLLWLGSFYAPFLPLIAAILNFFMFYIKKFACLVNSRPSVILYRASRSNSLFMLILLLAFAVSIIPVVYSIAEIIPSRTCGPFRGLTSVWNAATTAFMKMPFLLREIIFFFSTAHFAIPCIIVLILSLYYYYAVATANKHMVNVLRNQLVLEGHDKQFLLNRLSSFIKQQQEYQKRHMRQMEAAAAAAAAAQQPPPIPHRDSRERNRVSDHHPGNIE